LVPYNYVGIVSAVEITDNEKKLQSILDKYSINISSRFRLRVRESHFNNACYGSVGWVTELNPSVEYVQTFA